MQNAIPDTHLGMPALESLFLITSRVPHMAAAARGPALELVLLTAVVCPIHPRWAAGAAAVEITDYH